MLLAASPARASELVVGVVRDRDGFAVAAARVTAVDAGGSTLAEARSGGDGTFAADAPAAPARVRVSCAYCETLEVPYSPDLVVVVRRYAALRDPGITAADAAALPYDRAGGMLSLLPFTVLLGGALSDRWLGHGHGALVVDGLPFYRASDAVDAGLLLPSRAAAAANSLGETHAGAYGGRSGAGLFTLDTLDAGAERLRADTGGEGDAVLRAGGETLRASAAWSRSDARARAAADGTFVLGSGHLTLRAASQRTASGHAGGGSASWETPMRGATLAASLASTGSYDRSATGSDVVADLSVRGGSAVALTAGVRWRRSAGSLGTLEGVQRDARAYVEAAHDDGVTRSFASLAVATVHEDAQRPESLSGTDILPSLEIERRLSAAVSLRAGYVASTLLPTIGGYAADLGDVRERASLREAALRFDDHRRLRAEVLVFRQSIAGETPSILGGAGFSATWQLAPAVAIRAWRLIAREHVSGATVYAPALDTTSFFDRDVIWLTAGTAVRLDAVLRGGVPEGALSLPLGPTLRLAVGTRKDARGRTATLGISAR